MCRSRQSRRSCRRHQHQRDQAMCEAVYEWFVLRGLVDTPWLDLFILMSAVRGPNKQGVLLLE